MRIGVKADDHVGQLGHLRRNVGVQIECRDDGRVATDEFSHRQYEFALGVLMLLGHHRAMQIEKHAVDRQRGFETLEKPRKQFVKTSLLNNARRLSTRAE